MKHKQHDPQAGDLPAELASPAQRALVNAGYIRLDQLAQLSAADLKQLHGMGPKALDQLRRALGARGLSFADEQQQRAT
jgi:hypothetical protein